VFKNTSELLACAVQDISSCVGTEPPRGHPNMVRTGLVHCAVLTGLLELILQQEYQVIR